MYAEVKGEVASALLALIAREREGEAVDHSLVAGVVDVLDHSECVYLYVCVYVYGGERG